MEFVLTAVCGAAGLVTVIEAVNKIHRTDVRWRTLRPLRWLPRLSAVLRAVGWFALLLAGGGIPWMQQLPREYLEAAYLLAIIGSAALILRARLQEVHQGEHDAFERTMVMHGQHLHAANRASMAMERARQSSEERT